MTWQMKRGIELEPEARARHEFLIDTPILPGGFVMSPDDKYGASADGLIGDNGGAEYKCLIGPESLRDVYLTGDLSEYLDQVQGGMWLTGRAWWDFCVYCPPLSVCGRDLWRERIARDGTYITALAADLAEFDLLVEKYRGILEND